MAFKSKVEKMAEFVPNNPELAEEAYNALIEAGGDIGVVGMEALGKWMHEYTFLGYKCLCYTVFYVSQGLTPSWLGGEVEPVFESKTKKAEGTRVAIGVEPKKKLDLSFFLNI